MPKAISTSLSPFHFRINARASVLVLPPLPSEALERMNDILEDYQEARDKKFLRAIKQARKAMAQGQFLSHQEAWV